MTRRFAAAELYNPGSNPSPVGTLADGCARVRLWTNRKRLPGRVARMVGHDFRVFGVAAPARFLAFLLMSLGLF